MAIWMSWNIDIRRSLNSRDSFRRRKFKNLAPTSCSPGPILSPPTISFELHAKTAEGIDLEKCNFRNFGSSVTLTLTLGQVEVTLVHICGRGLPTYQIKMEIGKTFCGRTYGQTDTPEFQSTRSSISSTGQGYKETSLFWGIQTPSNILWHGHVAKTSFIWLSIEVQFIQYFPWSQGHMMVITIFTFQHNSVSHRKQH